MAKLPTANNRTISRRLGKVLSLATLLAMPLRPSDAQDHELQHSIAVSYIRDHAEREDMVMMPMRDGVRLYSLILFPKGQPRQGLPAVLIRHPYLTEGMINTFAEYVASFLAHGYAVVLQNERGRYFSEGTYTFLVGSGNDGYDTVEWLTRQRWSNGSRE